MGRLLLHPKLFWVNNDFLTNRFAGVRASVLGDFLDFGLFGRVVAPASESNYETPGAHQINIRGIPSGASEGVWRYILTPNAEDPGDAAARLIEIYRF